MAGLFGARRPMLTDIQIPVDAPAQIPMAAQQPQRRGLFGRLGSAVTPRNLMVVGATLQELGGRRGALGGQIESMQAAEQANAAAIQQAEQRAADEKYRQQALELQRQRLEASQQPQFEGGAGFTNAYRIDPQTGEVIVGGALPLRPRAPLIGSLYPGDSDQWDYED